MWPASARSVTDAVGGALGDAQAGRDVAQAHPGSCAMRGSTRAWLIRQVQLATISCYQIPENCC
jgi:hypothetical protein